jgi:CpeT protein
MRARTLRRSLSTLTTCSLLAAMSWGWGCGPIVIPKTLSDEERAAAAESASRRAEVTTVASWMTGSFSSEAQAALDPDFLDIRLEMARIWSDRQDGIWLYVEQSMASALERPYRQRVYRVFVQPNGLIVSEVYELPGVSLRVAGAHRRPELLADVTPRGLTLKDGCQVVLKKSSDAEWAGGTVGPGCLSSLRGASYATSEVTVTPEGLRTLDRGFNADGQQVWGSTKGAYDFRRVR